MAITEVDLGNVRGATGAPGADGYSPTVTANKANGVTTITIKDINGTRTASVLDGAKGDKGDTGASGKDGVTISVNGQTHDDDGNVFVSAENIPISATDQTTIADKLDGISSASSLQVTLAADGWTELSNGSFKTTATVADMSKSQTAVVGPDVNDIEEYGRCYVHAAAQDGDVLTFESSQKPSRALTVNVLLVF